MASEASATAPHIQLFERPRPASDEKQGRVHEKGDDLIDSESVSSAELGPIIDARDIKKKQVSRAPGDFAACGSTNKATQTFKGWLLFWLAYQSTGIIYGDIGTSPLYVYSSTFSDNPSYDDLVGALSIIIWSLTLIVTVKYTLIVLSADDEGEGGTFAIYSLLARYAHITKRDPKSTPLLTLERYHTQETSTPYRSVRSLLEKSKLSHGILKALAVLGVSLVMADGVLTPAQSVLGAIQGLTVVNPDLSTPTIVGVTCAILVLLFLLQPFGIARLGSAFAPIIVIWMLFNLAFGIYNLAMFDYTVLRAFSPYFAGQYFVRNGTDGWYSLGGLLLAFTGVEALFADLGAFSKRAIQMSWLGLCFPCLLFAYIGQAAYISVNPAAYANPFFASVPPGTFYPALVIAILAAIVASQAMITSTFQLLSQIINMSYFPQVKMIYTSTTFHGQVYVPFANWLLMIGTIIVTAVYNNTTSLGHAYGVCVIFVTSITTCLVALVAILVWRRNMLLVFAVWLPFITLDGLYLSSALTKVPDGAWFTLMLAGILASIFILWRYGKETQWAAEAKDRLPATQLVARDAHGKERLHSAFGGGELTVIKGLGIFFDKAGEGVPAVYAQFLQKFQARPEVHVFLHLRALSTPICAAEERYTIVPVQGIGYCFRIIARYGYNEELVTRELGSVVYNQIRRHLVGVAAARAPSDGEPGAETPPELRDQRIVAALDALDRAYTTQTVYIAGKEQLRVVKRTGRSSIMEVVGPAAWRRLVLGIFMFIRENTRTRVAQMKIPVDKLVEVGFVKEI